MTDLFDYQNLPDILRIKVVPKAKSELIKKETDTNGVDLYKVYVTAAPEDNKANQAVIKLLSKTLGISKSRISIMHGHTSRKKIIKING